MADSSPPSALRGRPIRLVLATLTLPALVLAACDGDAPLSPPSISCDLSTLGVQIDAEVFSPQQLHAAMADVEERATAGLGASAASEALRSELSNLRSAITSGEDFPLCAVFDNVAEAIETWDDAHDATDPGRPDFSVIRWTLALYEASIREHRGFGPAA